MKSLEEKLNFLCIPNLGKNVRITVAPDGLIMNYTLGCSFGVTGCFIRTTKYGQIRYYYSRKVLIRYGPDLIARCNAAYYYLKNKTRVVLLQYKIDKLQVELNKAKLIVITHSNK